MLKAVFFDLDGTLVLFDEEEFVKAYTQLLINYILKTNEGYDPKVFTKMLMTSIVKMYNNNGKKTNEEVFWENYKEFFGEEKLKDKEAFTDFYLTDFKNITKIMQKIDISSEIIKFCKQNNLIAVLSTNPFFPSAATETRIDFAGLNKDDFDFVTTMENFSFSKPNPMYFKTLLDKYNLSPDEVIVFGNNEKEDADCANAVGIKAYLIQSDFYQKNGAKKEYNVISINDVINVIKSHM